VEVNVKIRFLFIGILLVAGVAAVSVSACRQRGAVVKGDNAVVIASHGTANVSWQRTWDGAFKRAREEKKAVVVDFYADWCVWCRRLDSTTYRDPKVVDFLSRRVIPLKLNVDAGEGRKLAGKYHVDGLPTILVLSAEGKEIGRIPGYMPAAQFLGRVQQITASVTKS